MPKVDKSAVSDATAFFISRPSAPVKDEPELDPKEGEVKGLDLQDKAAGTEDKAAAQDSKKPEPKPKRAKVAKSPGEPKVKKGFLLSESLDRKIDLAAAELGIKKSVLAEKALEEYLENHMPGKEKGG